MKLIPLSKTGKHAGKYFAQVDDEDYDFLMQWNWHVSHGYSTKYAVRNVYVSYKKRKIVQMHRIILGVTDPKIEVDHKNHDGFNNQKTNLRTGSKSQNQSNRRGSGASKYLGVSWHKIVGKWCASTRENNKQIHLGYFADEEAAARAYDNKAKEIHGEWANLNFPSAPLDDEPAIDVD
jgi:hypothetical protein